MSHGRYSKGQQDWTGNRNSEANGLTLVQSVQGYTYLDCLTDNSLLSNGRLLSFWDRSISTDNTPDACATACHSSGYTYMGVEDKDQCFCSNSLNAQSSSGTGVSSTGCNEACAGDSTLICGGPSLISVYSVNSAQSSSVSELTVIVPSTSTSSLTVPSTTQSATSSSELTTSASTSTQDSIVAADTETSSTTGTTKSTTSESPTPGSMTGSTTISDQTVANSAQAASKKSATETMKSTSANADNTTPAQDNTSSTTDGVKFAPYVTPTIHAGTQLKAKSHGSKAGMISGIVLGILAACAIVAVLICVKRRQRKKFVRLRDSQLSFSDKKLSQFDLIGSPMSADAPTLGHLSNPFPYDLNGHVPYEAPQVVRPLNPKKRTTENLSLSPAQSRSHIGSVASVSSFDSLSDGGSTPHMSGLFPLPSPQSAMLAPSSPFNANLATLFGNANAKKSKRLSPHTDHISYNGTNTSHASVATSSGAEPNLIAGRYSVFEQDDDDEYHYQGIKDLPTPLPPIVIHHAS